MAVPIIKRNNLSIPMAFSTLFQLLRYQAQHRPEADAILSPGRRPLTYAQLLEQVQRTVAHLRAIGIGRGDRTAVVLPNGPEMAVAFLSTACAGASAPLNPGYTEAEYEFYLSDLKAKGLVVFGNNPSPVVGAARKLNIKIVEISAAGNSAAGVFSIVGETRSATLPESCCRPEDCALVLHTSGTTSKPKLVPLTQQNICMSADNIQDSLSLVAGDRCLNVMPLFHIHGLVGALSASLSAGASVVCTPGFNENRFFDWMEEFKPSWYTAVPTMHQAILSRAAGHSSIIASHPLRFIRSCSSALPPQLMADLEQTFRTPVVEAYGMTEACHQISVNPLPPYPRKPKSVGLPSNVEVGIMDERGEWLPKGTIGEIVIKGLNVTIGYELNPSANSSSFTKGWFRTGDQGTIDRDGYVFITGRIKEIINRGGEKIAPREVDEVFLDHPWVAQALTFAVPHPTLGQDVAVAVVPRGQVILDEKELREFAFIRLAPFKVPSKVIVVDAIPKGPTGKLQRIGLYPKIADKISPPFVAPRDNIEKGIAGIWEKLLNIKRVGVNDNFFLLGGDSLSAVKLVSEIKATFGVDLPLPTIFRQPTVDQLSRAVSEGRSSTPGQSIVRLSHGWGGRRVFCLPATMANVSEVFGALAGSLEPEYGVYGFQDSPQNPSRIEALAAKYVGEMVEAEPEGPYHLLGICSGGVVAFEMAQQLRAARKNVGLLALVEPPPPYTDVVKASTDFSRLVLQRVFNQRKRYSRSIASLNLHGRKLYLKIRFRNFAVHWAVRRYLPKPYPGPVHVYLTDESLNNKHQPRLDWGKFADNGLKVRRISGTRQSITGLFVHPDYGADRQCLPSRLRFDLEHGREFTGTALKL